MSGKVQKEVGDVCLLCQVSLFRNLTHSYRPRTKLREGNVFTSVSFILFMGRGSSCDHCPWCVGTWYLPLLPIGPSPDTRHGTYNLAPLLLTSGGHHWRPVQTCSLENIPPPLISVLTSSGGHENTYSWQAGITHPIGMLSLLYDFGQKPYQQLLTSNEKSFDISLVAV